ncbi:hypothetical protein NE237_025177 [Protea cynaroides]|uniref:DNA-directed RNA polymerase subunit beta n=1 Tax=Protea cynaroides TaxID=273540 RepID=A0A9Q0JZW7_9MAGN|nr:hypothetical protein NE237_025177 [Protea cynaroides]
MGEPEVNDDSGMSSEGEKLPDEMDMDFDQNGDAGTTKNVVGMDVDKSGEVGTSETTGLSEELLSKFRREASKLFFNEYGLISHQIYSYNEFVEHGIQKVFDSVGEITVEPGFDPSKKGKGQGDWRYASVTFGKVTFDKPMFWTGGSSADDKKLLKLMPWHARLQNMTYSGRLKVNIKVQVYTQKLMKSDKFKTGIEQFIEKDVQCEEERDVVVGRIPVMVQSKSCWMDGLDKNDCCFDHGGYFLIKGAEKIFIAQEQICLRRLWVSSKPTWTVAYRSDLKRRRVYIKLIEPARLEEAHRGKHLTVYFLAATMPIWILFFALGVSSDKEIVDMIDLDINDANFRNILFSSILDADRECTDFRKNGKALKYVDELFKKAKFPPKESIEDCFSIHLFPALTGFRQKALFLAYMVKCLLLSYTGKRKCENRDDFRNKRLELAGELLERELRVHIKHAERRMVKALQRDLYGDRNLQPIEHYLDASIITNGLSRAFSTGAWAHPFKKERMSGIVANLRRTNPLQMMVDLRKTRQQVGYTGKVGDARFPHPSHWGRLCFLSTPDGENCGLVKNLSVTGLVSTNLMEPLLDKLLDCGMEKLTDNQSTAFLSRKAKVFLNGEWVGGCEDCLSFVADLRNKRQNKEIPPQWIPWLINYTILRFLYSRPWSLNASEDHSIPKAREDLFPGPNFIMGRMLLWQLMFIWGYNQEDSLVLNRASLERGMFRTEHIRSYKAEVDNKEMLETRRQKPKDRVDFGKIQSKFGRVDSLDDDGFPYVGANLQTGDIVIGRCAESGADHSVKLKHTERGKVQKVVLSANDDGKNYAVVSLRQVRSPCLGDKFSSMHGQKGVVGLLESQEDFPFTLQGIVPDIVINPHAFPTRQTLGQLFESALGKGIAGDGLMRYATPFTTPSIEDVTNQLHRAGYERWGSEKFCNGLTGEMMQSLIFVGPAFYQRLIHMAEDKVKFRNTGPVHPLTRQPVADRKRFGGVKFGEMERDCLIAHGAAANLHERLFTLSDFSQMHICRKCTNIANVIQRSLPGGKKIRGPYCRFCESADDIVKVNVPYGAKLLCQELFSMGISVKFDTEVC